MGVSNIVHATDVFGCDAGWFEYEEAVLEGDGRVRGRYLHETDADGHTHVAGAFVVQPSVVEHTCDGEESIYLVEGSASLDFADGSHLDLGAGDFLHLPDKSAFLCRFHGQAKEIFSLRPVFGSTARARERENICQGDAIVAGPCDHRLTPHDD